jgi:hypothetical protein
MASLKELNDKHDILRRGVELAIGGGLLFIGIAALAGTSPGFAAWLSRVTGAKFI